MQQSEIRRQQVWSKTLRWCHWGMTLSVLVLLFSGWLIAWAPERAASVNDAHFVAAAILIAALIIRLWLAFFGRGSDLLKNLLPGRHQLQQGWKVLRAYLSLGKIPLPKWYAHNPLWAPIYLFLFVVVLAQIASGLLLLNQVTLIGSLSLRQMHVFGFQAITLFTLLHILASFFHDAKGSGSDISAMINGHRIFVIDPPPGKQPGASPTIAIPLNSLQRSRSQASGK
ncbi:cytochrome b/b6 domain-containing protein [Thiolapillus sp.]